MSATPDRSPPDPPPRSFALTMADVTDSTEAPSAAMAPATARYRDPVCGMEVAPERAAARQDYAGTTYFFCSTHCAAKFRSDPQRYLVGPTPSACCMAGADAANATHADITAGSAMVTAGTYYCPMHPEIQSSQPGSCPLCGMALEAGPDRSVPSDEADDAELQALRRRMWTATILTIPIVLVHILSVLPGFWQTESAAARSPRIVPHAWDHWLGLILSTPVIFVSGGFVLRRAWDAFRHRTANMFTLIALGVLAAWGASVAVLVAGWGWGAASHDPSDPPQVYFETAAMITTLVIIGQYLEAAARRRTGDAIRSLMRLTPETALRVRDDGSTETVPLDAVRVGDRLRIRPGDRIPTDGVIREGSGTIDESMLTGEPLPAEKGVGQAVFAGTLAVSGTFVIEASRVGAETVLARIIATVAAAQRSRAPVQRLADRVAAGFVPVVLFIAIVTFVTWLVGGGENSWSTAMWHAVAVLVIACPCALGLATPAAVTVGIGRAATLGILIRSAEALERLCEADVLICDKTGTLTEGRPQVVTVVPPDGYDESGFLTLLAAIERLSTHPLATAILTAARQQGLSVPTEVQDFHAEAGQGLRGVVVGKPIIIGTAAFAGVPSDSPLLEQAERLRESGHSIVFAAINGQALGLVAIRDPLRADAAAVVAALRADGVQVIMASGDHRRTVAAVARQVGIDVFFAGLSPLDKAELVRDWQRRGRRVAFAGDGINDAPALAVADVGIALRHGADVALEAAGIVLMRSDLRGVLTARRLSQVTLRTIRQNLIFAFAYNILSVPIAAGVLVPWGGPALHPMLAAAAMSLSSVSVVANALRLRWFAEA